SSAIVIPERPPTASPTSSTRPVMAPSSRVLFNVFMIETYAAVRPAASAYLPGAVQPQTSQRVEAAGIRLPQAGHCTLAAEAPPSGAGEEAGPPADPLWARYTSRAFSVWSSV